MNTHVCMMLKIFPNIGYSPADALGRSGTLTVGELREMLADVDDSLDVVTYDESNYRGAQWGVVRLARTPIDNYGDDDDE